MATRRGESQLVLLAVRLGIDGAQRLQQLYQSGVGLTFFVKQWDGVRSLRRIDGELVGRLRVDRRVVRDEYRQEQCDSENQR